MHATDLAAQQDPSDERFREHFDVVVVGGARPAWRSDTSSRARAGGS
jgi:hypothetical protein